MTPGEVNARDPGVITTSPTHRLTEPLTWKLVIIEEMGISRNISERRSPVRLVAKDGSAGKTERLWADWGIPLRGEAGAKGRAYTKLVVSVIRNQNKAGAEVSDSPPPPMLECFFWALSWKLPRGHIAISGLFLLDWNMAIIHSLQIISLERCIGLLGWRSNCNTWYGNLLPRQQVHKVFA